MEVLNLLSLSKEVKIQTNGSIVCQCQNNKSYCHNKMKERKKDK